MTEQIITDSSVFTLLSERLRQEEGLRLKLYEDINGYATIGYGRNLDANFDKHDAELLLARDVKRVLDIAHEIFDNFDTLTIHRQIVIGDMIFNLGKEGFLKFKNFIDSVKNRQWREAAINMEDSEWARQLPKRSSSLIELMEKG